MLLIHTQFLHICLYIYAVSFNTPYLLPEIQKAVLALMNLNQVYIYTQVTADATKYSYKNTRTPAGAFWANC